MQKQIHLESQPPLECPYCQSPLKELKGVSKKNGKEYHFWSCSAYPNCQYTWRLPTKTEQQQDIIHGQLNTIEKLITTEFTKMHKRLDGLAQFLSDKKPEE